MIMTLVLEMISFCIWFCIIAHYNHYLDKNNGYDPDLILAKGSTLAKVTPLFSLLPLSLFLLAVILNLNNWIFYYFKIGEMASHVDIRAKNLADSDKILKFKRILNFVTVLLIAATLGSLGYLLILILDDESL